jgi:hypothetical protein
MIPKAAGRRWSEEWTIAGWIAPNAIFGERDIEECLRETARGFDFAVSRTSAGWTVRVTTPPVAMGEPLPLPSEAVGADCQEALGKLKTSGPRGHPMADSYDTGVYVFPRGAGLVFTRLLVAAE